VRWAKRGLIGTRSEQHHIHKRRAAEFVSPGPSIQRAVSPDDVLLQKSSAPGSSADRA
jgi:hypothetical protein